MNFKFLISAAALSGSMLLGGVASAATLVTINTAGNGVDTSATALTFQATGATGAITSVFNIASLTGASGVAWTETGVFQVAAFGVTPTLGNPLGTVPSNVLVGYDVFADINFAGTGGWGGFFGNIFSAQGPSTFNLGLRAVNKLTNATVNLGTAALLPTSLGSATVSIDGAGRANTSLTGDFRFTPAPGTTGVGNFFQAPIPFNINFSVGNFGGNPSNTTYVVNPNGSITVRTPGAGLPAATGNLTFVGRVPEPGALALVGIALAGLGLSMRRKQRA